MLFCLGYSNRGAQMVNFNGKTFQRLAAAAASVGVALGVGGCSATSRDCFKVSPEDAAQVDWEALQNRHRAESALQEGRTRTPVIPSPINQGR